MERNIVVFDTDVGTDDAIAFLMWTAIGVSPDFILTSYGNTSLDGAVANAVLLKKVLNLKSVIVRGISDDNFVLPEISFHGADGLGGCREKYVSHYGITQNELDDYQNIDEFRQALLSSVQITYICTGPLTNLAALCSDDVIKSKIKCCFIMGGGINEFNCPNNTEFNFSKNPDAVSKILLSGMNITLFPLDLTNRLTINSEELEKLMKIDKDGFFSDLINVNRQANLCFHGVDAAVLHDTMPVLFFAMPRKFSVSDRKILPDSFGATKLSEHGSAVHVAERVESDILYLNVEIALKKMYLQSDNDVV